MFGNKTTAAMRQKFMHSASALAVSAALFAVAPQALAADKINGVVAGQVSVEDGANLANVTVVITHDTKGISRTTTTDSEGKFNIKGLPIGNYTIVFSKDGFQTVEEQRLEVKAGNTSAVVVAMSNKDIERIQVNGSRVQFIDFESSTAQITLTSAQLETLPIQQDITSIALLSPASSLAADQDGDYGRLASFNGSSVAENGYFLNGLNITDIRKGLGHVEIPWEAIAQTNVVTGGVSAEYGQFIGGVTDLVTKSGSNEFKFGVSVDHRPGDWASQNPDTMGTTWEYIDGEYVFTDAIDTINSEDYYDSTSYNLYASGALIEDKLFFYGLLNPQKYTSEYASTNGTFYRKKGTADFWLAKLDWYLTDDHSIGLTALNNEWEQDYTNADFDLENRERTGDFSDPDVSYWGGSLWSLNYTGILSDDITVSAVYGVTEQDSGSANPTAEMSPAWTQHSNGSWERWSNWVGQNKIDESHDKRTQMRVDLDWELDDHTIRIGYSREVVEVSDHIEQAGDGFEYNYRTMTQGTLDWINGNRAADGLAPITSIAAGDQYVRTRIYSRIGSTESVNSAFYIQDTWRVNDEWTLNLGLRNSAFSSDTGEGDTYVDMKNQWAPRLGVTWDVNGEGTTKLFANHGRYFMPMSPNTSVRMTLGETNQYRYNTFDGINELNQAQNQVEMFMLDYGDGTFTQPYQTLVDDNLEPMYMDELAIGISHELNDDWMVGVRYIYQDLRSSIEDTNMAYVLEKWTTENPEEAAKLDPNWNYGSDWVGIVINPGSPVHLSYDQNGDGVVSDGEGVTWSPDYIGLPEAKRKYQGLEFTIEGQPLEGAYVNASYTYSKSEGNTEGLVSGVHSQADPGWSGSFDSPEFTDHSYGRTSNDIPHKFKFYGSYQVAENLTVGAVFFAQEGRARNILGYHPEGVDSCAPERNVTYCYDRNRQNFYSNGEPSPRGSGGHGDWIYQLDLSITYAIDLGEAGKVKLIGKVFNALDADTPTTYNDMSEIDGVVGQKDQDYGLPTSYQSPRSFLLQARYDF